MPDIDLDAIEARANAATDGPWEPERYFWKRKGYPFGDCWAWGISDSHGEIAAAVDDLETTEANAAFIAHARTDVPALVALVRAKQSWIDGAKVDLDGYDEARAAIAAVRALHRPVPVQDECDHDDVSLCGGWETADGWFLCGPVLGHVCAECVDESGDHNVSHPCATVAALDVRHDPSATTDVARVERGESSGPNPADDRRWYRATAERGE